MGTGKTEMDNTRTAVLMSQASQGDRQSRLGGMEWVRWLRTAPGRENIGYEIRRWLGGAPQIPNPVSRILVVCQGNICRSPFAELLLAQSRPDLDVRSAGIAASGNDPVQPGARRVAEAMGFDLAPHRSTPLTEVEVEWADLIVGMEGRHVREVVRRWPAHREKALILGDFLSSVPRTIPDPWGKSDAVFWLTFKQILKATEALAQRLDPKGSSC